MEDFMFCLLGLDLLGRPAGRASLQGTERFWCYHLKFILNDCYCLMAAFLFGEQRRRPASECTCIRCRTIWFLRCRYIFFWTEPISFALWIAVSGSWHRPCSKNHGGRVAATSSTVRKRVGRTLGSVCCSDAAMHMAKLSGDGVEISRQ